METLRVVVVLARRTPTKGFELSWPQEVSMPVTSKAEESKTAMAFFIYKPPYSYPYLRKALSINQFRVGTVLFCFGIIRPE
jgi:hypothetical protein